MLSVRFSGFLFLILGLFFVEVGVSQELLKFKKKELVVQSLKQKIHLSVEIADTEEKQQQGLMFRTSLKKNEGMLFIFSNERTLSFWMKNTFVDLDIGFFNKQKVLVDIQSMTAMKSVMDKNLPSYPSRKPALYALEVPKGWFQKNKITLGSTFILK